MNHAFEVLPSFLMIPVSRSGCYDRHTFRCICLFVCVTRCVSAFGLDEPSPHTTTNISTKPQKDNNASIGVIYHAPAWGPDTNGEEVVYFLKQVTLSSRDDEHSRIYLCSVKPDGSERQEVAQLWKDNPGQHLGDYAKHITMEVNAATRRTVIGLEEGGGIFVVNLDGSEMHSVCPKEWKEDRPQMAGYPTWSPDGEWLSFHEYRGEKGFNLYRIVKCRTDGTDYTPLTERQASNMQPAWSPRGDRIAYVHYPHFYPGGRFLWLMKPDGSDKRGTTVLGDKPRWSPDGKSIMHDTYSVIDPISGNTISRYPYSKDGQGVQMWPKWGKSGFVFVDSHKIGFTTLEGGKTVPLFENIARRCNTSDLEKEKFRW